MDNKPLIISGSARKDSYTRKLLDRLFAQMEYEFVDLLDHTIYPYDYSGNYPRDDDFLKIIETVLNHDNIVFATPVYWYAMSGHMKIFFDRLTDLVTLQTPTGRKLKGRMIFLVAVGADRELPNGFVVPFRKTAEYLDMEWGAAYYCRSADITGTLAGTDEFIRKLTGGANQGMGSSRS